MILFIADAGAYSLKKIFCNKEYKNNILSVTDNNANWSWGFEYRVNEDKTASTRVFHKQLSNLNCIYFVGNEAIEKFKFIIIWKESKNTNKYKFTTFSIIYSQRKCILYYFFFNCKYNSNYNWLKLLQIYELQIINDNDINKLKTSAINYWTIEFEFTIAEEVGYNINSISFQKIYQKQKIFHSLNWLF